MNIMANDEKCIFCNIGLGKIKSRKVFEDEIICAFLDINPANPGHVLIIPKEHYQILPMVPSDVVGHMYNIAKKISMVMFSEIGSEGTSYLIANGMSAGQKAPHVIMHVIARFEADNIGLVPETFEVTDKDIDKIQSKISESLIKVFEGKGVLDKKTKSEKSEENDVIRDDSVDEMEEDSKPDDENQDEDDNGGEDIDSNKDPDDDNEEEDDGLESKFDREQRDKKEIDIDKIANLFLK